MMGTSSGMGNKPMAIPIVWITKGLVFLASGLMLFAAYCVYLMGQPLFGAIIIVLALGFLFVFGLKRFYFARFIYPGIATMALFVIFPIFYPSTWGSLKLRFFQSFVV